jgi:hypothetical protein
VGFRGEAGEGAAPQVADVVQVVPATSGERTALDAVRTHEVNTISAAAPTRTVRGFPSAAG